MDNARGAPPAISLSGVEFRWPGGTFGLRVDDFTVARGEAVLLVGESGSGKSTLLSLICAIATPSSGRVEVEGTDLAVFRGAKRDRFRADTIGIVFQLFNLLPYATGLDNILVPLSFSPARRARCTAPRVDALRLSEALGLPETVVTRGPASALSVGQQQRVAAARALIGAPSILVADEPTSALDRDAQDEFLSLVFSQVREAGLTFLMVSHDESLGERFDRVVRLSDIAGTGSQVMA
ncbi:MAG: ABC transporter ATP-binding protein [Pseudomonadota bacterium]